MYKPLAFSGNPVRYGARRPALARASTFDDAPIDPNESRAQNSWNTFDRYVVAEYRDRFADDKAGITLRGYVQQFVRGFHPLQVLAPSPLIQGGLAFDVDLTSYRVGGAFDGDVELAQAAPRALRRRGVPRVEARSTRRRRARATATRSTSSRRTI